MVGSSQSEFGIFLEILTRGNVWCIFFLKFLDSAGRLVFWVASSDSLLVSTLVFLETCAVTLNCMQYSNSLAYRVSFVIDLSLTC